MRTLLVVNLAWWLMTGCSCPPPPESPAPVAPAPAASDAPAEATPPTPAEPAPPTPPADAGAPTPDEPVAPEAPATALPGQGQPCDADGRCADGLACLRYYGIAGPRGPEFTSCEIRCGRGVTCPAGQRCRTIADGPGPVCR